MVVAERGKRRAAVATCGRLSARGASGLPTSRHLHQLRRKVRPLHFEPAARSIGSL